MLAPWQETFADARDGDGGNHLGPLKIRKFQKFGKIPKHIFEYVHIYTEMILNLIETLKTWIYIQKHTKNTNIHFQFSKVSKINIFKDFKFVKINVFRWF